MHVRISVRRGGWPRDAGVPDTPCEASVERDGVDAFAEIGASGHHVFGEIQAVGGQGNLRKPGTLKVDVSGYVPAQGAARSQRKCSQAAAICNSVNVPVSAYRPARHNSLSAWRFG